jgi:DNA polymerase
LRLATTQTGLCIPYRDETLAPTISDESADERRQAIAAHGDHFEDAIERHVLAPRFNWPLIPLERHRCTMAMALAAGLPARLSASAAALELANRKDAAGERLMHQTSKPRRARQDEDPANIYWFEDPDRLNRLYDYCRQDVEVERELYTRLPSLSRRQSRRCGS